VGAEGIADFAPSVEVDRAYPDVFGFAQNNYINAYMANAIGVWRMGHEGRYEPFLSGGYGAINFRGDINDLAGVVEHQNQSRVAGNVGGGLMSFAGSWGFRADVRWFRATRRNDIVDGATVQQGLTKNLLSGLDFWRANVGVAFRW